MRINRRNTLIGLGTIVAGGGAALGTGAFSQVQAERTIEIHTTDDSDAFLGFSSGRDEYSSFVNASDGEVIINIGKMGEESDLGLNENALTAFDEILSISNNSADSSTSIEIDIDANDANGIEFYTGNFNGEDMGVNDLTIEYEQSEEVGVVVDLRGDDANNEIGSYSDVTDPVNVTITATAVDTEGS